MTDYQRRDCERLAELHGSEDPRSLAEMIAEDPRQDYVVETVKRCDDGYEITFDGGITGYFQGATREPREGDVLGLYTDGRLAFGSMRHGWAINGEVMEWKTPWERFADRIMMLAEHDRKRRERAEGERTQVAEWLALLRGPYRERIERFRAEKPTFDLDGGTYETYPVLMAQRIEDWVRERHPDAAPKMWEDAVALVKELENLPYAEQEPILHGDGKDIYGVSGHQVGSAFGCAARVLMGEGI